MASVYDGHVKIVKKLKKMGEKGIYNPTSKSFMKKGEYPDVYVKSIPFPSEFFISGTAFQELDGTISIMHDHLAYYHTGYGLDDLGLCDPILWYENSNLLKKKETKVSKKCPHCGKKLD